MTAHDEFFSPEVVDEQIDFLSRQPDHQHDTTIEATRLVSHLRQLYAKDDQKHTPTLERAWSNIVAQHQRAKQAAPQKGQLTFMQEYQGEPLEHQTLSSNRASHKNRSIVQRLGILAAVVFVGLLVGIMLLVLHTAQQSKSSAPHVPKIVQKHTNTGSDGKPHPKPPNPITGSTCTLDTTVPHPQQSTSEVPGLYIFAFNEQSDNLLYRYDQATKKVVWSKKLCSNFQSTGTVAYNGILYLAGTDWTHESQSGSVSYLYALNETDGSVIWGKRFPTSIIPAPVVKGLPGAFHGQASPTDLGMIETPTIVHGIAYAVQRSGIVYALDAATGGQLWTYDTGRNAWATTSDGMGGSIVDPSSIQVVNGIAYGSIVDRFFALDPQSGKALWAHSFNKALNINWSPAIANGTIYLTAFVPGYGSVMNPDTYIYAFDARTGMQKWVTVKMRGYINGPLALGSKVYVMSYDGIWYTLNSANGTIEAQKKLPISGVNTPVAINGVLYAVDTRLAVLNPDGSVKWSVPVSSQYPFIDDVQQGVIYVSGRGSGVYAYSANNGTFLWHYAGYLPQPGGQLYVTIVS